nr:hypothetical transcript [Hymenolepis microstoma]
MGEESVPEFVVSPNRPQMSSNSSVAGEDGSSEKMGFSAAAAAASQTAQTLVTELTGPNASAIPRITARRMRMEILPQIASTVVPSSQDVNRSILAVEFWHSIPGRQNFANLTLGCGERLLQTAILKSPTDSKRIIIDNFGGEEGPTVLPKVLITNRPEEMKELLPKECIIIPCFVTALSTAVTNGIRRPETIAFLQDLKKSLGVCQNGTSNLSDFTLEAITWREVSDLLAQTRSEQRRDEVIQLRGILEIGRSA